MGLSPTMVNSYEVFVHGIHMFITSNRFKAGLEDQPDDVKDYVKKNAVLWEAKGKLYIQPAGLPSA